MAAVCLQNEREEMLVGFIFKLYRHFYEYTTSLTVLEFRDICSGDPGKTEESLHGFNRSKS